MADNADNLNMQQVSDTIKQLGEKLAMEVEDTSIAGPRMSGSRKNNSSGSAGNKKRKNNKGVQNRNNEVKVNADQQANVPNPPPRKKKKEVNPYASAVPVPAEEYMKGIKDEDSYYPDENQGESSNKADMQSFGESIPHKVKQKPQRKEQNHNQSSSTGTPDSNNEQEPPKPSKPAEATKATNEKATNEAYNNSDNNRFVPEESTGAEMKNMQQAPQKQESAYEPQNERMNTPSSQLKENLNKEFEDFRRQTQETREVLASEDEFFASFDRISSSAVDKIGQKITRDEAEDLKRKTGARATLIINTRIVDPSGNVLKQQDENYNASENNTAPPIQKDISACLINIKTGELYEIPNKYATVGKGVEADCRIDEHYISRRHSVITRSGNKYYIEDTNSTNGTYVNERKLEQGEIMELKNGDIVKLADISLQFVIE